MRLLGECSLGCALFGSRREPPPPLATLHTEALQVAIQAMQPEAPKRRVLAFIVNAEEALRTGFFGTQSLQGLDEATHLLQRLLESLGDPTTGTAAEAADEVGSPAADDGQQGEQVPAAHVMGPKPEDQATCEGMGSAWIVNELQLARDDLSLCAVGAWSPAELAAIQAALAKLGTTLASHRARMRRSRRPRSRACCCSERRGP